MQLKSLINRFKGRGPLINIVLDGWGMGDRDEGDAISQAATPTLDRLFANYAHSKIYTHGHYVGLPSAKDIGGSEVGHLTMGAGRIIQQGATRIKELFRTGKFFEGHQLNELVDNCLRNDSALHLLGLLSDGNVHSHISHFEELIGFAHRRGVKRLYVHALLDGRDVPYQSALDYVETLEETMGGIIAENPGWQYAIASGGGREVITMDRDQNWEKVRYGWQVHVHGREGLPIASVREHVTAVRKRKPDIVDQDITPFVVTRDGRPIGPMRDGDSVIFMNFRGDRAIEISRAMVEEDFQSFDRGQRPQVLYAGMMVYDEDTNLPPRHLVETSGVANPFGKRILELGLNQFRLAETQKYAHVTFFFNGGYREPLDPEKELYHLIPSDRVDSFAEAPAMKAMEIAGKAVELIRGGKFQFGLINFANADMVGHTGNLGAAVQAAEAIDSGLGLILEALRECGGLALITADHGNAEQMVSPNPKTGKREPNTRHSINPVPVILFDPRYNGDYRLRDDDRQPNRLSNLFATNYILLGREPPGDVDPSLFDLPQ
ncbi:MAG: 2,3-bisphosphoglycerate-independent phosphoglycerate mutase [SAR324 cluster bacterium]|nr:2,3-bisphosphoglycerate-independent phosphoglycerate mutase [SAR324 cluster bacterium]